MTQMTVSPRLLQIFGKSLYSGESIEIVSRELIQNSRDACILNNGSINFTLSGSRDNNGDDRVRITCDDKGIGMNLDTLENVFLSLGSTLDQSNGNKVGGFGIAKASIFASDFWSIHTKDNYLDYSMLESGESTKTNYDNRQGSIVNCEFRRYLYGSNIRRIVEYIEFSDINNIEFKYELHDTTYIQGKVGNQLKGKLNNPYLELSDNSTQIKVYMLEPCNLVDFSYTGNTHKGLNIYRLGGLVQYINNSYTDRDTNIIIDVHTTSLPGDSNYPFSMSRESLNSKFDSKIYDFISTQDQNTLTSNSLVKKEKEKEKADCFIDPYLYHSHLNNCTNSNQLTSNDKNELSQMRKNKKIKITPDMKKILKAFSLIMESVNQSECFYTGITIDNSTIASRNNSNYGIPIYFINPDKFLEIPDKDTICISLWHAIIHEFSHKFVDSHNEKFTSTEGSISREITPNLFKLFNYISRVIFRRLNTI